MAKRQSSSATPPPIREHDIVELIAPMPSEGLRTGVSGTVVHIYRNGEAYEVEFIEPAGSKVVTLSSAQVKPAQ